MSGVVVGYVPSAEGRAALQAGAVEARLRSTPLGWADRRYADATATLLRPLTGRR